MAVQPVTRFFSRIFLASEHICTVLLIPAKILVFAKGSLIVHLFLVLGCIAHAESES